MSQSLTNEREIHISYYQMRRQRVFEGMGMPFLWCQHGSLGACPEDAKELRPVELSALLTREQKIAAVRLTLAQPSP
jgi:hypothetical protein